MLRPVFCSLFTFIAVLPLCVYLFFVDRIPLQFLGVYFICFLVRLYFFYRGRQAYLRNKNFSQDLKDLLPTTALVYVDNDIESRSEISAVREGHIVRMQGEAIIPVDGFISYGSGFVDESALTGNKHPVLKTLGSPVFAGTKSMGGALLIRTEKTEKDTYLSKIADQLDSLPSYQAYFFDLIFIASIATLYFSATFLPYALLLSAASIYTAIIWNLDISFRARASALGCVWKDEVANLFRSKVIVSGKDVLIEKKVQLTEILGINLSEDSALRLMGPLARRVENPPAFSVLQELKIRNIPLEILEVYVEHPEGSGGVLAGDQLCWIENPKEIPDELKAFCVAKNQNGERLVFLEINGKISAAAAFEESIQQGTKEAIENLAHLGFDYILVHPDKVSVSKLAEELNIKHVSSLNEELFVELEKEGLQPVWFGKEPKINSVRYGVFENCEASVLEGNLTSLSQAILLARTYLKHKKIIFITTLFLQCSILLWARIGVWSLMWPLLFILLLALPSKIYSLRLPESV